MNIIIDRTWKQGSLVNIEDLRGLTFQAEAQAHTFRISGVDAAGNPITLTGTPSGVMLRPDNTDVALTCAVSDGKVTATLPAECYDVPGRVGITIYLTSNSQQVCIYSAITSVNRTSSGTASPGTTSSVVDLVNAINAAINSIPASYSNLLADIAPTYSDSALYAVGQYAWYDGDLKRCIVPITTSESYTDAHWTSAVLGQDVCDLKSALSNMDAIIVNNDFRATEWENKGFNPTTHQFTTATNRITSPLIYIKDSSVIIKMLASNWKVVAYFFSDLSYDSYTSNSEYTSAGGVISDSDAVYAMISVISTNSATAYPANAYDYATFEYTGSAKVLNENRVKDIERIKSALSDTNNAFAPLVKANGVAFSSDYFMNGTTYDTGVIHPEVTYRITTKRIVSFPFDITVSCESGFETHLVKHTGETPSVTTWSATDKRISANTRFQLSIRKYPETASGTASISEYYAGIIIIEENYALKRIANIEGGLNNVINTIGEMSIYRYGDAVRTGYAINYSDGEIKQVSGFVITDTIYIKPGWNKIRYSGIIANNTIVARLSQTNEDVVSANTYVNIDLDQSGTGEITYINDYAGMNYVVFDIYRGTAGSEDVSNVNIEVEYYDSNFVDEGTFENYAKLGDMLVDTTGKIRIFNPNSTIRTGYAINYSDGEIKQFSGFAISETIYIPSGWKRIIYRGIKANAGIRGRISSYNTDRVPSGSYVNIEMNQSGDGEIVYDNSYAGMNYVVFDVYRGTAGSEDVSNAEIYVIYDNILAENAKNISILFVGNSLTQDAISYLPYVLKTYYPEIGFRLYMWYNGGYTLSDQYSDFTNDVKATTFSVAENSGSWTNYSSSKKMSDVLKDYKFDVVCMQEYFTPKASYTETDLVDWNNCRDYISENYTGGNGLEFISLLHAPKRDTPQSRYEMVLSGNDLILEKTISDDMIPVGIAIYKALSTSLDDLGDQGHLSPDGVHAQEGIPCLIQTYTAVCWLLDKLGIAKSVYGCPLRFTEAIANTINIPNPNPNPYTGHVITGTDAQNLLAQEIAIKAYKEGKKIVIDNLTSSN